MNKKALIIIDMQVDFLPEGRLAVADGDQIIPEINHLVNHYPVVVATQDWHPANHSSFASQHPGKNVFDVIDLKGSPQVLWPDHCVQGSDGAALTPLINWNPVSAIFRKGMDPEVDSYSGFFDNAHVHNTGLDAYLKSKDITQVDICGLAADYCVYFTALDALDLGYHTTILLDATKAIDEKEFSVKKENFKHKGGILKGIDA